VARAADKAARLSTDLLMEASRQERLLLSSVDPGFRLYGPEYRGSARKPGAKTMPSANASDYSRLLCPRCRARPTVQSAVELRQGVEYLTLRCIACGLIYDAQAEAHKSSRAPSPGESRSSSRSQES
jgi:hypothetical protein